MYAAVLLVPVWILLFAAVLVALLLDGAASLLRERVFRDRLPPNQIAWVIAVVLLMAGSLVVLVLMLGPDVLEQMDTLGDQVPRASERLQQQIAQEFPRVADRMSWQGAAQLLEPSSGAGQRVARIFSSVLGAFGSFAVVLVIGLYLAMQPRIYVRGCLALFPHERVAAVREALQTTGAALRRWLLGRLTSMLVVLLLTTLGLWLLGSPLALSLGLLAGLFTFIPFIGPLLSAAPAVLLGLMESPTHALWISLLYVAVQLIEGNLATPLIQSYAVQLRPAVLLAAQLIAGSLFGMAGLIIAAPLAVALTVFVQVFYVNRRLQKHVEPLGAR